MKFTLAVTATLALASMASALQARGSCTKFHTAEVDETCNSIAEKYNTDVQSLYLWNTDLTQDNCNSLSQGQEYCVESEYLKRSLNTFRARKRAAREAQKHGKKPAKKGGKKPAKKGGKKPAKKGVTSADNGCADVASKNGITLDQLYGWNTGLHHKGEHICDNLDDGKAYCVGV
ncbi:hypothetical protein DFQ29_000308 [Apophysomyces sp. BC1021]|nr:hypothetical protein DFQ29_000308 [Apophysomyces sp. BC1021]